MAHVAGHLSIEELEDRYRCCVDGCGTALPDDLVVGARPYDYGSLRDHVTERRGSYAPVMPGNRALSTRRASRRLLVVLSVPLALPTFYGQC
jgi:hypothetical protein